MEARHYSHILASAYHFTRLHALLDGNRSTVRSENRCVLIKCVGSDVHERLYGPEPV